MGIQYYNNFLIKDIDDLDLESDILSAVRRAYFATFEKIRDKITYNSDGDSMLYDYCIEKNKPMRWTVKNSKGVTVQEVLPSDNGRYYLCFYRDEKLIKRLLFSKLHTLLKAEYMDDSGVVCNTLEPRKAPGGLRLLLSGKQLPDPVILSEMPPVNDSAVLARLKKEFTDYSAVASTNEGIVWYLSDEQISHFRSCADDIKRSIEEEENLSFIGDEAPLFEKISAADFNIKRNLSASLDISLAKDFEDSISADSTDETTESEIVRDDAAAAIDEQNDQNDDVEVDVSDETASSVNEISEDDAADVDMTEDEADEGVTFARPDKLIKAEGAIYSYYGELDGNDNRSGYGRTFTDLGRIAYEGMYKNDKRSGKGAYFYKDGTLCYSGDWAENVRHGVGVGVSSRDGSMHIGRWVNNKPEGNGVRLTADGEIKFVCKELADGGTALLNYLDDDTVVISKYDKDGKKLSEKSVSLTDI